MQHNREFQKQAQEKGKDILRHIGKITEKDFSIRQENKSQRNDCTLCRTRKTSKLIKRKGAIDLNKIKIKQGKKAAKEIKETMVWILTTIV